MPLEHELVELNNAYQNTVATNMDLRERCQQLEQLVKDYDALAEDANDLEGRSQSVYLAWETRRMKLQQHAKELLASE